MGERVRKRVRNKRKGKGIQKVIDIEQKVEKKEGEICEKYEGKV